MPYNNRLKSFKFFLREDATKTDGYSAAPSKIFTDGYGVFMPPDTYGLYLPEIATRLHGFKIPITPKLFSMLSDGQKNTRAIHVTGLTGIENLLKIQGSAKSISCSSFVYSDLHRATGVTSANYGVVVGVEGTSIFESHHDIFSETDSSGRRWVPLKLWVQSLANIGDSHVEQLVNKYIFDGLAVELEKVVYRNISDCVAYLKTRYYDEPKIRIFREMKRWQNQTDYLNWLDSKTCGPESHHALLKAFGNKALIAKCVTRYIDECNSYITRNKKAFQELFRVTYQSINKTHYNEVLVSHFSIKKIWINTGLLAQRRSMSLLPNDFQPRITKLASSTKADICLYEDEDISSPELTNFGIHNVRTINVNPTSEMRDWIQGT